VEPVAEATWGWQGGLGLARVTGPTGGLFVTRDMRLWLSKVLECSSHEDEDKEHLYNVNLHSYHRTSISSKM
jgi:hypothetical protein